MKSLLTLLLLAGLTLPLAAKPVMVDLVDVPVDKMLASLKKRADQNPKDAHASYLLGRVHAIAWAQGVSSMKAERRTPELPYFGIFDQGFMPAKLSNPERKAAQTHLDQAVAAYAQAVKLDPELLPARLGYAWCLDQAGKKAQAVEQYRVVFEKSYQDYESTKGALFGRSLTEEAGGYLLKLLDPAKDAREIARIKTITEKMARVPRAMTPVLIPLDPADPLERLLDPGARVSFDLDGSGVTRPWDWITPRAGWLVYRDRRKSIDSGLQLMGSVSWWVFWRDGYEAMSALDQDGDGWLRGPELEHLELWCDRDQDGRSTPEELLSLESLGIQALSCRSRSHSHGFPFSPGGVLYRDGRRGDSYDWVPSSEE